jgi:hypothetical protein
VGALYRPKGEGQLVGRIDEVIEFPSRPLERTA